MRIANAPVSWGAIEFENDRGDLAYPQVLDEIRDTGYLGTELGDWGFLAIEPEILSEELSSRSLSLIGAFVQAPLWNSASHEDALGRALRAARLMSDVAGSEPFIVLSDDNATVPLRTQNAGRIRPEHALEEAQWQTFCEGASSIARKVQDETGLRTVFHHHGGGYIETSMEVNELLNRTDPDLLGLCLDTGHLTFGGGDAAEAVRSYGDRIRHVHFKDWDQAVAEHSAQENWDYVETIRRGVFCELGQGAVDFPAVLAALQAQSYAGWIVVEQDLFPGTGTPKESAARNREYLRALGI